MDPTHWFRWITVAGAAIGLLAAVQQLLLHGLQPFVRALLVTLLIGSTLVLVYPMVQPPAGGGTQVALATSAPAVESAPAGPAAPAPTSPSPIEFSPAITPVEPRLTESVPAEAAAAEPTAIVPPPLNRGPSTPGAAEPRRAESSVAKPLLPVFLPAQQKMFSPSEVAYCPICFSAFSSRGPALGVRCPHCAASVNLVSRQDYMVHRCGKCGRLHRTTHFPPAIGPYFFRYYCSFCRENRWFPN